MSIYRFDIHGLVTIEVRGAPKLLEQVLHQIRHFQVDREFAPGEVDIVVEDSHPALNSRVVSSKTPYRMEDDLFVIPPDRFAFQIIQRPFRIYVGDYFIIPLNLFVELVLLSKGATFVHAAAIRLNGRTLMLPALGGVGKTIAMLGLLEDGAEFFGDDLCIVQGSSLFSYPVDFSIYRYHLPFIRRCDPRVRVQLGFSGIVESFMARIPASRALPWRALRRVLGVFITPCFSVPYSKFVPPEKVVSQDRISGVFLLRRSNTADTAFERRPMDAAHLTELCATTLLHEWHQSMRWLMMYSIFTGFDLWRLPDAIRRTISPAFEGTELQELRIPSELQGARYQEQIRNMLRREA